MIILTIYVVASYALWSAIGTSTFPGLSWLRDKAMERSTTITEFIYCPLCSGFWCAFSLSFIVPINTSGQSDVPSIAMKFVQALCGAGFIFLIEKHVSNIDAR